MDDDDRLLAALLDAHPQVDDLAARFAAAGHELHLVGGAVRDALLGQVEDVDLDFTTNATPEQAERVLRPWADAVWLTGAVFGTVSAARDGRIVEVTTYRSDVYEPGSRHPAVAWGERVEQDLSRRDFTVNALALRLPERTLVDEFGGRRDLDRGVLRTPVDPRRSFDDDPLRMLRLARFAARLDFTPDATTLGAARAMAADLRTISAERVRTELVKLLTADHPGAGLDVLAETGLLGHVPGLADLADARLFERLRRRFRGPLSGLAAGLAAVAAPDVEVAALALATLDLDDVATRLRALTCSVAVVRGVAVVHDALRPLLVGDRAAPHAASVRRVVAGLGEHEATFLVAVRALAAAQAELDGWVEDHLAVRARLADAEDLTDLRGPLDGRDVMTRLGRGPGPHVGRVLALLRAHRLDHGPYDVDEAHRLVDAWAARQRTDDG